MFRVIFEKKDEFKVILPAPYENVWIGRTVSGRRLTAQRSSERDQRCLVEI